MSFLLYPAIDVLDGQVTRLQQGDYARDTRFGNTPLAQAQLYSAQGASWLHLVDLDGARRGRFGLQGLIGEIKAQTALKLQTGGGIRNEDDVRAALEAGADRVVLGSVAVREPQKVADWLRRYGPQRLVIALDTRQDESGRWSLPIHGWTEGSGEDLIELLKCYVECGALHVLCTDIARDGMLGGINAALYRMLVQRFPALRFQASGGVAGLEDVREAKAAGAGGIVLGRALLEGRFAVDEALRC